MLKFKRKPEASSWRLSWKGCEALSLRCAEDTTTTTVTINTIATEAKISTAATVTTTETIKSPTAATTTLITKAAATTTTTTTNQWEYLSIIENNLSSIRNQRSLKNDHWRIITSIKKNRWKPLKMNYSKKLSIRNHYEIRQKWISVNEIRWQSSRKVIFKRPRSFVLELEYACPMFYCRSSSRVSSSIT